jgi:NAD(P)-dependent dehydrogenase (short-subunit alcohol dehydrogenase family)
MSGQGPVYIVTAAGRGLGAACARRLADDGARLVLLSPSGSAEALAAELGATGMSGSIIDPADLAKLAALAMDTYGRIDGAVVNTGILASSLRGDGSAHASALPFDPADPTDPCAISDEAWLEGFEMMFLSIVRLMRELTPVFRAQGKGAVVAISTFTAPEPRLAYPVASCVRAGLAALVKIYADRFGREGIRFNSVLPGFIGNWDQPQEVIDAIPLARLGDTREISDTVRFLLSDEAGYITGQSILVDGGVNRSL